MTYVRDASGVAIYHMTFGFQVEPTPEERAAGGRLTMFTGKSIEINPDLSVYSRYPATAAAVAVTKVVVALLRSA